MTTKLKKNCYFNHLNEILKTNAINFLYFFLRSEIIITAKNIFFSFITYEFIQHTFMYSFFSLSVIKQQKRI